MKFDEEKTKKEFHLKRWKCVWFGNGIDELKDSLKILEMEK